MKPSVKAVLLLGFGALLLLIGILGVGAIRRANEMYDQMKAAQQAYELVDQALRDLPADIHLAGILVRDYAIDPLPVAAPIYKEQLAKEQLKIERHLKRLSLLNAVEREKVGRLQEEIQVYADSLDPILGWSAQEKVARSFEVIRGTLIPKRQAIVNLTQELSTLNAKNLAIERQEGERGRDSFQRLVSNLMFACLGLGLIVGLACTRRIVNAEHESLAAQCFLGRPGAFWDGLECTL